MTADATHAPEAPEVPGQGRIGRLDPEWWVTFRSMATTTVLGGAVLIVLATLHPYLILRNNTPTGGDMGAHVWGPAYLRDHLLPDWSLSGWSMDFYSGFPMYRFYMVVPALMIVVLDVILPYGIAFKLVAVAGLLALPVCAWAMGRLARLPFPMPELLAVGSLLFLFDESYTIYGGNIPSTMAGEFAFSISLAFAVVAFGLFARGLDDGRHRGWAAFCIAMSALCHGIVLLFVFTGVVVMTIMRLDRQRLRWAASTIVAAVLLSAFWVLPFLGGHAFMTDMKYEARPSGASDSWWDMYFPLAPGWDALIAVLAVAGFAGAVFRNRFLGMWMGVYAIVLALAVRLAEDSLPVIGLLWNPRVLPFFYLLRYALALCGVWEIALWIDARRRERRARVATVAAPSGRRPGAGLGTLALTCLVVLVVLGARYHALPGGRIVTGSDGTASYAWGPLRTSATRGFSDGWARWNFEGYEGKAAYGEYHDLVATMARIGQDPSHGCGRALWENNGATNKYGTTMALMLLPFWTDGCIASMEGLYFEAAGTTPYHFIAAAAMSSRSSNPVRELRYVDNDADRGVAQMRELGVRYYMGFTADALSEARAQPDLVEIAASGPWRIFELRDSAVVVPLGVEPVVVRGRDGDQRERWLEVGTSWFQNPSEWAATPVADGPPDWQRIDVTVDEARRVGNPGESGRRVDVVVPVGEIERRTTEPVVVSDVTVGDDSVSFRVDKVGVPVLVRVSYFPTWTVSGADGPWRAAPNMMVVVPTEEFVTLRYSPTPVDTAARLMTLAGVGMLVWFARRPFRYGFSLREIDGDR